MQRVCRFVEQNLDAYVDGELGWLARKLVSLHLALCPHCAEELEHVRRISVAARESQKGIKAPPQLRDRIKRALQDKEQQKQEGEKEDKDDTD